MNVNDVYENELFLLLLNAFVKVPIIEKNKRLSILQLNQCKILFYIS